MGSIRSSLHRRNFINNQMDDMPMDTIGLVSPINAFLHGNFSNDDSDYPEKPLRSNTKLIIFSLVMLAFVSALSGYLIGQADYNPSKFTEPEDPEQPLAPSASWLHVFQKAAVCTDAPHCSGIGRAILSINGSAVDAAIAAMFCNGLLNQQSMGIGGGFFMTVYIKEEEKAYSVIAREKAPAAAKRDMFGGSSYEASKGSLSIGVPGEVRGMWEAHKRWGRLPWEKLIKPTLEFCKYGFTISKAMYDGILSAKYIKNDPTLRRMYWDPSKNAYYRPGTLVTPSPALCRTLTRIAKKGGDEMYNGSLAADLADDLNKTGSIITAEDLKLYQPKITEPLVVPLGNGDILYTPPPPSSGAILANILNILSGYNFTPENIQGTENKILTYHRIIEAFKFAYAARTRLGDMDFLDLEGFISNLTSPEYGVELMKRIDDLKTSNDSSHYGATTYTKPDHGTAHISVISEDGDAVSVTSSINFYFGSGVTATNTGILLNNVMDDFSSPGFTNYFNLEPSPANFIEPHKRPMSTMCPSIIIDRNGNAKMVIGAAGGTKIASAVALVTMRKLWFGQTIKESVDEARIHHQIFPMHVEYEYGIIQDIIKGLRAKGHGMVRYRGRGSVVCALYRNKTGIYANADFRKGGDVSGID
ncbi:glutathione hydrolase 1 proenzyme-like isoform X2 [Danaus plexippus]|uniref:glutathione hydrolase 1 proenzyme-like isoform X2 n=1 Tax=Danaus plexippus TaxID=13037 RepID=UPI002AAFDA0C|nr:glutathione hydrolase 1 proenzyme-like isoform X2 [Danaus plexippus]